MCQFDNNQVVNYKKKNASKLTRKKILWHWRISESI